MCHAGNWDPSNILPLRTPRLPFLLCSANADGLTHNLLVCNYFIITPEDEIEDFLTLIYLSEACHVFFNARRKSIVLSSSCCTLCWLWYTFVPITLAPSNNFTMSFDKFCKSINHSRRILGELPLVLSDSLMHYLHATITVAGMNVLRLSLADHYFVMSCSYGESTLTSEWNLPTTPYFKTVCGEKYERWCAVVQLWIG